MKLLKLFLMIIVFILSVFSVNAANLDVRNGAEVNGIQIQGNGFTVDASGKFQSRGGSGKIGGYDIAGDISSGNVGSGKLTGTAGANAQVAGVKINNGVKFELDLSTGKITTPNGGLVSVGEQKINLGGGSGISINSDGSYSTTGYAKIDVKGYTATGTDISYKDGVFASNKDLKVTASDGKISAFGENIAVNVKAITIEQANSFLNQYKNSAALNIIGDVDTKQKGLISVSIVGEKGLTTTTIGLEPETIITRQGKDIIYEYTGNEKNFARTTIDYKIGDEKGTMITEQQKERSKYTSKIAAFSLNTAAKPHPDATGFTVNDINLLFKDGSGSTTLMANVKDGIGPTSNTVTTSLETSFQKPENVQIAKNGDINARLIHSPMIIDVSIRPNPASIENSLISDNPQENIGEFMRNGKFTLDMAFNLQKVHLQSFFGLTGTVGLAGSPLRSSLQDMFVVSGVEGQDLLRLEEGINAKVSGGGIFSSGSVVRFDRAASTISFYSKPSDSQPYLVKVSPLTINRILNEKIGPITNYLVGIPAINNKFTRKR